MLRTDIPIAGKNIYEMTGIYG